MNRRRLLTLSWGIGLCLPGARLAHAAGPGAAETGDPGNTPRYKVSAAQLQQAVAARFPMRWRLGGWMNLTLKTPELRMLAAKNRIATELFVDASGPALPQPYAGGAETEFASLHVRNS